MSTETTATAAASGSRATDRFRESGKTSAVHASQERVNLLASKLVKAVNDIVLEEQRDVRRVQRLQGVADQGGRGRRMAAVPGRLGGALRGGGRQRHRHGNKGTIEGPYYIPEPPEQQSPGEDRMRADEPGTPLLFQGQVSATDGKPLPGAKIELWHADDLGFYSQFAPGLPEWNLRGSFIADAQGKFQIDTMQPAPYQIPTDGACGQLIAAAGWHAWRPAHIHLKVSAAGPRAAHRPAVLPGRPAQRGRHRHRGEAGTDARHPAGRAGNGRPDHLRLRPRPRVLAGRPDARGPHVAALCPARL